ncbi:MAG: PLP-dependent aminotransferase family protein [Caulobacteraceae bacterium]|nr:PLP-dependent aminotransferase family protein [Caulobacteraceae bacterium]
MPPEALAEGHGAGWPGLRDAIASHLATTRGVRCDGSQVFVTTSVRAGIGLVARALKPAPASAWVEDPGYFGFKDALRSVGIEPRLVPVDADGLDVDAAVRRHPDARLAIVTPTAHFPTGVEMSAQRRSNLIAWARAAGGWILEDNYDSENRFEGLPAPPIASVAPDVTIYMNSFNRTLFPALRIAYMVLPESLVGAVARERSGLDGHTNVPNQIVMADFINGGGLDEHLRRCRAAYRQRRDALLGALETDLRAFLSPHRTPGGLQVVADLARLDERDAVEAARGAGILLTGMAQYLDSATRPPQVVMGFAGFRPADIAKGGSGGSGPRSKPALGAHDL